MSSTGHHHRSWIRQRYPDAAQVPVEVCSLLLCWPVDVAYHRAPMLETLHPRLTLHIPATPMQTMLCKVPFEVFLQLLGVLGQRRRRSMPRLHAPGTCGSNISLRMWRGQISLLSTSVPAFVPVPRFHRSFHYHWPAVHPISHAIVAPSPLPVLPTATAQ